MNIIHALLAFGSRIPQWLLVTEFYSFDGDVLIVIIFCGMLIWRFLRGSWNSKAIINNPVLILAFCSWILGFVVVRFWVDWGLPALMVWMSWEFQDAFKGFMGLYAPRRVWLMLVLALAAFLIITNDYQGRWTRNLTTEYLSVEDDPRLAEWLPEPGGIIYSNSMGIFFNTFFKNAKAPWRYMVGFEPAWMPAEDLAIFRNIQWNEGTADSFMPWVEKMRPEDRLIIQTPITSAPKIYNLQWCYAARHIWIGRLPRKPTTQDDSR